MSSHHGSNKLARTLDEHLRRRLARPDALELGTIQSDMSLLLDRFPRPIPQGDYLVCRSLTLPDPMTTTDGETPQNVIRPPQLAPLAPGDRVLVAWVNDGTDPVVIDVVVSGDA